MEFWNSRIYDDPGELDCLKSDGSNYLLWSYMIRTSKIRELWESVIGSAARPDPNEENCPNLLEHWDSWNEEVLKIIDRCVDRDLKKRLVTFEYAKEAWDYLAGLYAHDDESNFAKKFRLEMEIRASLQCSFSIIDLYTSMQSYWNMLAEMEPNELSDSDSFKKYREEAWLVQFLTAIPNKFEHIRKSILCRSTLPSVFEAVQELIEEEHRLSRSQLSFLSSKGQDKHNIGRDECIYCHQTGHWKEDCPAIMKKIDNTKQSGGSCKDSCPSCGCQPSLQESMQRSDKHYQPSSSSSEPPLSVIPDTNQPMTQVESDHFGRSPLESTSYLPSSDKEVIPQLQSYELRNKKFLSANANPSMAYVSHRGTTGNRSNNKGRNGGQFFTSKGRGFTQSNQGGRNTSGQGENATQGNKLNTPNVTCQICKRRGHDALKCWHRFHNSFRAEDTPHALAAVQLSDSSEAECRPDIAATSHITDIAEDIGLGTLKILSYNVWSENVEIDKRMGALGDLIQLHSPNVICFQEVTRYIYDIFKQSSWWEAYHCSVSDEMSGTRNKFCMQLSKYPVKSFSCKPFSIDKMRELCMAEIEVKRGKTLVVATSQLESPGLCSYFPKLEQVFSKDRVAQAKQALELLNKHQSPNVVFCGDMNWDDDLYGQFPLSDGWVDAWTELRPSENGWTYDTKSNPMLSADLPMQKRFDRFICNCNDFKLSAIDMIGTEAIPGLSYSKETKVSSFSYKTYKVTTHPILPSHHYGLLLRVNYQ